MLYKDDIRQVMETIGTLHRNPLDVRLIYAQEKMPKGRREGRGRIRESVSCKICNHPTHGGKEYCKNHLDNYDYIADLKRDLEKNSQEIKRVIRLGTKAISDDSQHLQDILNHLEYRGPITEFGLSKTLWLPMRAVYYYVLYLNKKGLVGYRKRKSPDKKPLSRLVYLRDAAERRTQSPDICLG